jgi:hypothetical protein
MKRLNDPRDSANGMQSFIEPGRTVKILNQY